ncbi:MAG: nitrite reductase, copper-containing, partial [Chloroflexi bacterium]|nr:nitrite reductase, copper-containing [Chloroflexota bacterium]
IDEFSVSSGTIEQQGQLKTVTFTAGQEGEFVYYCSVPGHRQAGMFGKLIVGQPAPAAVAGVSVVHHPADLPGPIGSRGPTSVRVDLTAKEVEGQLADGATFSYFTFNGSIPGPMIRVRLGDTIELHLKNETTSAFPHSIDLHAVTGPGGGAVFTQTNPGQETSFTFKALNVGLYVYHCATPSVAHHIANGMYGLILVEPAGGLPAVDREFYVMQGEVYTEQPFGSSGHLAFSEAKMLAEAPEYFIFNGAAGALIQDTNLLRATVGETVRVFFGVGGPNATSSFHVIGEIFDRAYPFAALSSPPLVDVQTVTVPPGGATMVEFRLEVPGRYMLVDHALSRLERGLAGFLMVDGPEDASIFHGTMTAGSGH